MKKINYNLFNNSIEFNFYYGPSLIIPSNSNIISLIHLKQLLKIIYFQHEFQRNINIAHKMVPTNSDKYIYLINKKFIDKYKNYFHNEKLYQILISDQKTKKLNYEDIDKQFINIVNHLKKLNETDINLILEKESKFEDNFTPVNDSFEIKLLNDKKNPLNYINDFEIINEDIYSFFVNNNLIKNDQIIKSNFIIGDGKILLIFKYNNNNYYEIGTIDKSYNFIIEYLLKEENNILINDIFDYFKEYEIKNIIQKIFENHNEKEMKYKNKIIRSFQKVKPNIIQIGNCSSNTISQKTNKNDDNDDIILFLIYLYNFENIILKTLESKKQNQKIPNNNNGILKEINKEKCYLVNYDLILKIKKLFSFDKIGPFVNKINISNFNKSSLDSLKSDEYYKIILNAKKDFQNNIIENKYNSELLKYEIKNFENKYYYPNKFNIINKNSLDKLFIILNLKNNIKLDEFFLDFNCDKIALTPCELNSPNKKNNNNYLLYIYDILSDSNTTMISYNLNLILAFDNKDLYNKYQQLIKEEKIMDYFPNKSKELENKYKCKCFLIKQDMQSNLKNSFGDSNKEVLLDKYISYSINLCIEYMNILKKIKQPFNSQIATNEYDYFLINGEYVDEIESILKFDIIKQILNNNQHLITQIKDQTSFNQITIKVKDILKLNQKLENLNIKEEDLNNKLQNINNLSEKIIHGDPSNKIYFYKNCKIFARTIINIINNLDKTNQSFQKQMKPVSCIFDQGKIMMLIEQNVINVGSLGDDEKFVAEYIFYPFNIQKSGDINLIFNAIKYNGYKLIENSLGYQSFQCNINNYMAYATIFNLKSNNTSPIIPININGNNQFNYPHNNFSNFPNNSTIINPIKTPSNIPFKANNINSLNNNTVKSPINLNSNTPFNAGFNNHLNINTVKNPINHNSNTPFIAKSNNNLNLHKNASLKGTLRNDVNNSSFQCTENLKILLFLSLNKIKDNIYNIQQEGRLEKVFLINNNWLKNNIINQIYTLISNNNEIINLLKTNQTIKYNSEIFNQIISKLNQNTLKEIDKNIINVNNSVFMEATPENIKIIENKEINIYKEFTLINQEIYGLLNKYFQFSSKISHIYYLHKNLDILILNNQRQKTILLGTLNKSSNIYDIKYILDYKLEFNAQNELNIIKAKGPEEYIREKTIFNLNDANDNISPIFYNNDDIMGYCYKYYKNINYNGCINSIKFLSNEKFLKVLSLYKNYVHINKKMYGNTNYNEERCYLINKNLCTQIKANYNYEEIRKIFEERSNEELNKKIIIYNIKKYNLNNKIDALLKKTELKKYNKQYMEPNIIPLNKNQNNPIMICDNFELFYKKAAESFFDNLYGNENNYLECILNEGKIIIKYPAEKNTNKKYMALIGILDNDNTFINEYLLIYKDSNSYNLHIHFLKGNLNKYLNNLQLYMNSAPIINQKYEEIGKIIKLGNNNENIDYNFDVGTKNPINNNQNYSGNDIIKRNNNKSYYIDESEYNLDYKTNSPYIKAHFVLPPLIGLQNIGATCYMNATLQCFCHIEKFINFFKYNQQPINLARQDKTKLSSSFKLLMEKLWPNNLDPNNPKNKKYYAPYEFKDKISKMNPLFQGVAANDAKDLVNFIIMTLHQELNKAINTQQNFNFNIDQRNQILMFNTFAQNYMSENKSIISDLFYGINCNITQCGGCQVTTFNYQTYFFLVFPLEEVRKFKMNNNQFMFNYNYNFNNNNLVNIFDCFNYDRNTNSMAGANAIYCNYCKRTCDSFMRTELTTGPEILIILLNRGKGIEFKVKINFVEYLDLSNYLQLPNTGCKYKLIGVITHMGESGMGGHFIAYCLDPISTNLWHRYNDDTVTQVKNFKSEVIDYAMPYLLFYQKIK